MSHCILTAERFERSNLDAGTGKRNFQWSDPCVIGECGTLTSLGWTSGSLSVTFVNERM